jgi:FAD synthase
LVKKFNLSFLIIGKNFRCGFRYEHPGGDRKSEGSPFDTDAASIKKMNGARGIDTEIMPPVLEASQPVSSSRIRAAITAGDLGMAAALLGRPFELDLRGMAKEKAESDGKMGWVYDAASVHRIIPAQGRYKVRFGEIDVLKEKGKVFIPGPDADSIELIVFPIGVI